MKKTKSIEKLIFFLTTDDIKEHRYASIDDWQDPTILKVSNAYKFDVQTADTGDRKMNFLILLHALVESYLCFEHGITDEMVSGYDMAHPEYDDPGSYKDAPYYEEHQIATEVEAKVSVALGVNWVEYNDRIDKVLQRYKRKTKKGGNA